MKREQKRKIRLAIVIILGIIFAGSLLALIIRDYYPQIRQLFDPKVTRIYLKEAFRSHGVKDACLLVGLTSILTAIPGAPVAVVCIFNGVLYGPWAGIVMNLIGYTLGNLMVVYLLVNFHFMRKTRNVRRQLAVFQRIKDRRLAVILGYAIPIIPSSFTSYMAIKMKLNIKQLVACIMIGATPTSLLYAFGGNAVFHGNITRMVIIIALILIIFVGLIAIYHKYLNYEHHNAV